MSFYGVIEEIWELNYNSFKVAIFKCDWVENCGGIKTDELGFVLVDLSRVGHKNDSFIFATQAKQVFFVEDPSDSRWSIVLTPLQRDFDDQYNDDELGDTVLNCQGMLKATIDIESRLDLDENTPTYIDSYTMELPTDEDLTLGLDEVEIDPPSLYAHIIDKPVWQEFARSRMSSEFQDEILDKAPNEESPNDALTQALGIPKYGRRVRGVGGFITPTVYFHQAKPRKSNKEKVLENVVKEKNGIATSVPPVSLTSKKKVVEEEEVIATRPMTKNEVKASRPMTKEVEVTSEPSNLPIQLKYLDMLKGALMIFQSQNNLKKTRKTTFWKACSLQVGTVECGYYFMRYMREIVSKDTSIITDAIDTRNSYSQLELDEVRVEWAQFLSRPQIGNFSLLYLDWNRVIVDDIGEKE
ncbi:uncharacterized protein E5676_scaffold594G00450 [Cucumis melo var. makuwa]|uniref:DUF4216 domain-containing protein n=1 Tax=Cucumis melo var. makuwa TaxID=1194695 RepID=A0A5D3C518_CUCMM|nr:uncharacterized protein E5676_scaffold594G00450 [Cucumis melo var. makuwa]